MKTQTHTIKSIELRRLAEHPDNPNRMSSEHFDKLVGHIERGGNYEPIIVRRHPAGQFDYQIINGHHRVKALGQLGQDHANCIVWDVDDDETDVLLTTLNRLCGVDSIMKRANLVRRLSRKLDVKSLSSMLPENAQDLERLKAIAGKTVKPMVEHSAFLNCMVFFLNDQQHRIVEEALQEATDPGAKGTKAQKKAWAIVEILKEAKGKRHKA